MTSTAHIQAAAPRLERPHGGRMIAGVSTGIARHLNVDPILVRLAFIVATFAGGIGFLAYVAGMLLIPEEGHDQPLLRSFGSPRAGLIAGVVLLLVGAVAALDAATDGSVADDIIWSAVLAGAGGFLLLQARRDTDAVSASPTDTTATTEVAAARSGSRVATRVVAGSLLLVAAAVSAIAAAGVHIGWQEGLGIAIVAAGATLVVGSAFGASPWLVTGPLAIAAGVGALAAAGAALHGPIGDRSFHPALASELPGSYRVAIGELDVDLSDVALPAGTTTLKVRVGIGEARVTVPAGIALRISGHAGAGEVRLPGGHSDGTDVDRSEGIAAAPGSPTLVLDAEVGLGELRVQRAGQTSDGRPAPPIPPIPPIPGTEQ